MLYYYLAMAATGFDNAPVYYSDSLGAPIMSGKDSINSWKQVVLIS